MTLTTVNTPGPIGPGSLIRLNAAGPYPTDDYFEVDVFPTPFTSGILSATRIPGSAPHIDCYLGYFEKTKEFFGGYEGVADGTSCHLTFFQFHANGTIVDTGSDTGAWTFTLRSPFINLLTFIGGTSSMKPILDAVIRTFPAP